MSTNERAAYAVKLAAEYGVQKYRYSQSRFNHQFAILVSMSKKGYMESRHDWRGFR